MAGNLPPPAKSELPGSEAAERWLQANPVERSIHLSPAAMAPYAVILAALDLPPDRLRRLRELIVEREENARDAERLGKDEHLKPTEIARVRADVEADFAAAIGTVVNGGQAPLVQLMLSMKPQLIRLEQTFGQELSAHHAPLSAGQILDLGARYYDADSLASAGEASGSDPAERDRQILAEASAVLRPEQRALLALFSEPAGSPSTTAGP